MAAAEGRRRAMLLLDSGPAAPSVAGGRLLLAARGLAGGVEVMSHVSVGHMSVGCPPLAGGV